MGKGRVTIPTDLDVVPQTLEMIESHRNDNSAEKNDP